METSQNNIHSIESEREESSNVSNDSIIGSNGNLRRISSIFCSCCRLCPYLVPIGASHTESATGGGTEIEMEERDAIDLDMEVRSREAHGTMELDFIDEADDEEYVEKLVDSRQQIRGQIP